MPTSLPQLDRPFLTDGGLETDLIFNRGVDLPLFASITLLQTPEGRAQLEAYFRRYLTIAHRAGTGFILESASWRASPDWVPRLGLTLDELARLNREAVAMLHALRDEWASDAMPVIVSGNFGPRGDGYDPGALMTAVEAETYHRWQANVLASAGADMLTALTLTNVPEAIGFVRAASATGLPAALSFTVETDGRLPTGDALGAAIEAVDDATGGAAAYFMVNCAHPSHFADVLMSGEPWTARVRGLRANASRCSHAELDAMTELDAGNPAQLGSEYRVLRDRLPGLTVLGGCCGTDHRHVAAIAKACLLAAAA